jgi:hypothetical protein
MLLGLQRRRCHLKSRSRSLRFISFCLHRSICHVLHNWQLNCIFVVLRIVFWSCTQLHVLQSEYKRGVSAWNFNIEDLKAQAALVWVSGSCFVGTWVQLDAPPFWCMYEKTNLWTWSCSYIRLLTFASSGQISGDDDHADPVKEDHDPLKHQAVKGHDDNISDAPSHFPSPVNITDGSLPQDTGQSPVTLHIVKVENTNEVSCCLCLRMKTSFSAP